MREDISDADGGVDRRVISIYGTGAEKIKSSISEEGAKSPVRHDGARIPNRAEQAGANADENPTQRSETANSGQSSEQIRRRSEPNRAPTAQRDGGAAAGMRPKEKGKETQPPEGGQTNGGSPPNQAQEESPTEPTPYNYKGPSRKKGEEGTEIGAESEQTAILEADRRSENRSVKLFSGGLFDFRPPERVLCSAQTRDVIAFHHPDSMRDERVMRWIVWQTLRPFFDVENTGLQLAPWQGLNWVWGRRADSDARTTGDVLRWLRDSTTLKDLTWRRWNYDAKKKRGRCRVLEADGISLQVRLAAMDDLFSEDLEDPIYALSGKPLHAQHGGITR